jgi:hypothetical protein
MMKIIGIMLALALGLSLASIAQCRTWYVKADSTGDAPTINAAIDSAMSGDDVLVGPGTYTRTSEGVAGMFSIIMMKAGIWLHSEAGPEATIIDAEGLHTVIWCSELNEQTIIEGLTITGGYRDGLAGEGGGGIHCRESAVTITGNIITNNSAQNYYGGAGGGGVFCSDCTNLVITDNLIAENTAGTFGGGIWCNGSATVTNNLIVDNVAGIAGGAIHTRFSPATIINNTIVGNSAPTGAAFEIRYSSSPTISRNIVAGSVGGAAFYCDGSVVPSITCNDLWDNEGGDGNCALGGDNFSAEPIFCDEDFGDYHLHEDSPCTPGNAPSGCQLVGALPVNCWNAPISAFGVGLALFGAAAAGLLGVSRRSARGRT